MPEQAQPDPSPTPLFVPPEDLREDFEQLYTEYITLTLLASSQAKEIAALKLQVFDLRVRLASDEKILPNSVNIPLPSTSTSQSATATADAGAGPASGVNAQETRKRQRALKAAHPVLATNDPVALALADFIKKWAAYTVIFYGPYITRRSFRQPLPEYSDPWSLERFRSPANVASGHMAELMHSVKAAGGDEDVMLLLMYAQEGKTWTLNDKPENIPIIVYLFEDAARSARGNVIRYARSFGDVIFKDLVNSHGVPLGTWNRSVNNEDNDAVKKLLCIAPGSARRARLPPILCKDGDTTQFATCFRSEVLYRV